MRSVKGEDNDPLEMTIKFLQFEKDKALVFQLITGFHHSYRILRKGSSTCTIASHQRFRVSPRLFTHGGGFVPPYGGGTSEGEQSVNGGTREGDINLMRGT